VVGVNWIIGWRAAQPQWKRSHGKLQVASTSSLLASLPEQIVKFSECFNFHHLCFCDCCTKWHPSAIHSIKIVGHSIFVTPGNDIQGKDKAVLCDCSITFRLTNVTNTQKVQLQKQLGKHPLFTDLAKNKETSCLLTALPQIGCNIEHAHAGLRFVIDSLNEHS